MKRSHLTDPLHGGLGAFLPLPSSPCAHVMFGTVTSEIPLLKGCGRVESSVLCQGHKRSPGASQGGGCPAPKPLQRTVKEDLKTNRWSVSLGKFVVSGKERQLVLKIVCPLTTL